MKRRESERGAALIIVIFASTLILLLLMTALTVTLNSNRTVGRQLASQGQAMSTANAGLTEGLSWFVRQQQQPVVTFDPVVDSGGVCTHVPKHDPVVFDSEQPDVGIVRSFEITPKGKIWGRYELRRLLDVKDVSLNRGKTEPGTIWQLKSRGTVYVRNDAEKAPNVAPNFVLAQRTMAVEIQRLGLRPPKSHSAAVIARRGNWITVNAPSRIQGGAYDAVAYPKKTGTPTGNGTVGTKQILDPVQDPEDWSIPSVFGVTANELIAMADVVVDDETQLPQPVPDMALVVIRGNATFTDKVKLHGSGILVVLGNLILNPQSNTYYSGVIWVGGNFNMSPPGIINGTVIANSNVQVSGGSEVAEINYDKAIIEQVKLQMGNYLFSRSPWIVTTKKTD